MIRFNNTDVNFNLKGKRLLSKWLKEVAAANGYRVGEFNYVFCSDDYLLDINKQFLGHDYYTDIITFDMRDEFTVADDNIVFGDVYISIDTIKYNGEQYGEGFERELYRVMAHGLLHLIGFDDTTADLQAEMTLQENAALALLDSMKEVL